MFTHTMVNCYTSSYTRPTLARAVGIQHLWTRRTWITSPYSA